MKKTEFLEIITEKETEPENFFKPYTLEKKPLFFESSTEGPDFMSQYYPKDPSFIKKLRLDHRIHDSISPIGFERLEDFISTIKELNFSPVKPITTPDAITPTLSPQDFSRIFKMPIYASDKSTDVTPEVPEEVERRERIAQAVAGYPLPSDYHLVVDSGVGYSRRFGTQLYIDGLHALVICQGQDTVPLAVAGISIDEKSGNVMVRQLQALTREPEKLKPLGRWEKTLVGAVETAAKNLDIHTVTIQSAEHNSWLRARPDFTLERAKLRYDVTAERMHYLRDPNGDFTKQLA